eukprot:TRINITY_DN6323_c0_g2_i1.p1 TRINITY_DN6323_c0_g2~~TRINITY_DN6323_c0_g2_i1.p1  ORF type:complete len:154 (-),score=0.82 TRINITY_DN6323_c0_g2_i1:81-476(-)
MYFIQTVLLLFGPETRWIAWMAVFNFNILDSSSPVCVAPFSPLLKLFFGMLIPLICLGLLAVTMLIHYAYYLSRHGKTGQRNTKDSWMARREDGSVKFRISHYLRTFLAFLLFSYNSVTKTTFDFLGCMDV